MSTPSQPLLAIVSKHLSADGTTVHRGEDQEANNLTVDAARAALRAFARLPAMELVDVEAKIYLTGPHAKLAVQNVGGRLFATLVPEAINTPTEQTPEQILAVVTNGEAAPETTVSPGNDEVAAREANAATKRGSRGWRAASRSPWTLVAVALATLVMAYVTFVPTTPAGVEVIHDPAKTDALHGKLNGRYGVPSGTMLVLREGKITGVRKSNAVGAEEKVFELNYRFGLRGRQIVMLVSNGSLLEQQADGGLKFLETVYPRADN
jgi:hypothetical protein